MSTIRWACPASAASESDVVAVEKRFGVVLPKDLRDCILRHNGAGPQPDVFDTVGEKGRVFDSLLSFCEGDPKYVVDSFEATRSRLPPLTFPFAHDPSGNFLCLRYRSPKDERPTAVFWEHDAPQSRSVTKVADSLEELLSSLYAED